MKRTVVLFFCILFVVACSKDNDRETDKVKQIAASTEGEKTDEISNLSTYNSADFNRPLTAVEKTLLKQPGNFNGNNYNEADLHDKIDQFPSNLNEEEYYQKLLTLFHADYYEQIKALANFDDEINVELERPNENIDMSIKNTRYIILLDASGSMAGQIGGITKMEIAKRSIRNFAEGLPSEAVISLIVYGHKGSNNQEDKQLSCTSTEEIYRGNFIDKTVNASLESIQPRGWTPLALALESIKNDIEDNEKVIAYVVSDGIETCGGDPVSVVGDLKNSNIGITVNVIGFDINNTEQQLLKDISDKGDGHFVNVNSANELNSYLRKEYEKQQYKWANWKELGIDIALDISNQKKADIKMIEKEIRNIALIELDHFKKGLEHLEKTSNMTSEEFNKISSFISERYYEILTDIRTTSDNIRVNISANTTKEIDKYNTEGGQKVNENFLKKNDIDD